MSGAITSIRGPMMLSTSSVNRRVNKNGMPWASAQLEDLTGGIEVMFFPHAHLVRSQALSPVSEPLDDYTPDKLALNCSRLC